ncbi:MAG: hypothetical protein E7399_09110 [Ruminococcaceae bacterium]|nr:hypothetical protein [Oscillospiraceae bacterium]
MLRLSNIGLGIEEPAERLVLLAEKKLNTKVLSWNVAKRSVDARKKDALKFVYSVDVEVKGEERFLSLPGVSRVEEKSYVPPKSALEQRPVIAGFGPAGMFAALTLAQAGARPVVLERGKAVEKRKKDIQGFWKGGSLQPESNVQFGEGGAGTFSDGKLTTGIKSPFSQHILNSMVRFGAPEEIVWQNKPHIGTDRLETMVKNLRQEVIALGGEVLFESKLTGLQIEKGKLQGVLFEHQGTVQELQTDCLILAVGHSARDTFTMLYDTGVMMEKKPFSVGVRIEHLQKKIDLAQYGATVPQIGAADYKLVTHLQNGDGVYTFCMCPGGQVVAAASEEGGLVTNGMSHYAREGENANSALLVGVLPEGDVFAGVRFQRKLEQDAYSLGGSNWKAPAQLTGDFLKSIPSRELGEVSPTYRPGVTLCSLDECLPKGIADALRLGILGMGQQLKGFDAYDSVLTGVETRSSSPVRILRNEQFQSVSCQGLYPCGEGAGYAGGIMSAAADGVRIADYILNQMMWKETE